MSEVKSDRKAAAPQEREKIVAYLAYALEDVRPLSEVGSQLLQLAIATIIDDQADDDTDKIKAPAPVASCH
jgi:hypothetical protein